jgi:hypothetical protein
MQSHAVPKSCNLSGWPSQTEKLTGSPHIAFLISPSLCALCARFLAFHVAWSRCPAKPIYARRPVAPRNASPVPHLTSLYHFHRAGEYGDRFYPGNCGGNLIKDLLRFFRVHSVFDPMTGSGTCRDVCKELGIYCWSSDIHEGADACDASQFPRECFEFAWIHPPYWRQSSIRTINVTSRERRPWRRSWNATVCSSRIVPALSYPAASSRS